jgi:hypothetical protein
VLPVFSSIHHHELPAQDRNRIAILQLSKFVNDAKGLGPEQFLIPPEAKAWGDALRRRLIEQWPRFEATLAVYQTEMHQQGYSGREQDTYGTLLACGDLLLFDEGPDAAKAMGRAYEKVRDLTAIVDVARSEAEDTSERCVKHLGSHRMPARGSEPQETVARWIQKLIVKIHNQAPADQVKAIRDRLGAHGMRVVHLQTGSPRRQRAGRAGRRLSHRQRQARHSTDVAGRRQQDQQGHGRDIRRVALAGRGVDASAEPDRRRLGQQEVALRRRLPENCVLVPLGEICDVAGAIDGSRGISKARPSCRSHPKRDRPLAAVERLTDEPQLRGDFGGGERLAGRLRRDQPVERVERLKPEGALQLLVPCCCWSLRRCRLPFPASVVDDPATAAVNDRRCC